MARHTCPTARASAGENAGYVRMISERNKILKEKADPSVATDALEIKVYGSWVAVTSWIWRSWAGERRFYGQVYTGPVYYLGTDEVARA